MDLRSHVKQTLRMCGHAIVSTIHERLNVADRMLEDILAQNAHNASTQTALLQSSVYLVENVARVHTEVQEAETRISTLVPTEVREAEARMATLVHTELREAEARMATLVHTELREAEARIATLVRTEVQEAEAPIAMLVREDCIAKADLQPLAAALAEMYEVSARKSDLQPVAQEIAVLRDVLKHTNQIVDNQIQPGVEKMLSLNEAVRGATVAGFALLEPAARETSSFLANQSVRQVCVETSDYLSTNPELGVLSFLYSSLPSRKVLDIGAHIGDVSEHLLQAGYEVYAFEPYPQSYHRLTERLRGHPGFHAFNLALGSVTGELPLHLVNDDSPDKKYEDPTVFHSLVRHGMPTDLKFNGTVPVPIRRLSDLHKEGVVPADAGLVKIDTEGYDLEVIRGMADFRYPAVMVEFWDTSIAFATQGLLYTLDSMVSEMRQRGYLWYIVIYRVWGENHTAYFCNHDRAVPGSWGNILFFQQRETFIQAQQWCSAVLPRTYFKHVPAEPDGVSKCR